MLKNISFSKTINTIILFLLAFCIIYSSLLCGSPLKNNIIIVNLLLNLIAITSVIINNFIYHKKISYTKSDIIILLLSFVYLLPIVFHTYSSISDTFDYFLRYISILSIYIIMKNIGISKKSFSIIVHSIMIGSFLIILIGIDDMSTHFFENLHLFLNTYSSSLASDIRLDSVFEYPNAFAAFINFSCILTIGLYLRSDNKYMKGIYGGIINLQIIAIILSGSRLNIAIFLFVLLFFTLLLRDKLKTLELIELFFIIFFSSLFYCNHYLDFISHKQYFFLWGFLLLELLFIFIIHILLTKTCNKLNNKLNKFSTKKWLLVIFLVFIIFFIILFILLQIPNALTLFNTDTSRKQITMKQINNIEPSKDYFFEFNIESTDSHAQKENNYQIMIFELNNDLDNLKIHRISFNEYKGWKTYQLTTTPDTKIIKIVCQSSVINSDTKLTIYNLYLNHSELTINYKFLPTNLVSRISNILSGDNSFEERFIFMKDGLKIGFEHFLTGSGANGWKYKFQDIQTSNYYTTEVHSYPVQLFIEVGFSGVLLYILLIVFIVITAYKTLKKKPKDIILISCICSLFGLFLHSCIDFDMSFFCVLLQFYTIIILFLNTYHSDPTFYLKNKKIIKIFSLFLLIILLFAFKLNLGNYLAKDLLLDSSTSSLNLSEKVLMLNPYNKSARISKISLLNATDSIKDLELFIKYEPNYSNIDNLKISYVVNLLKILDNTNAEEILNKISKISYSQSFLSQYVFKQNANNILELIKEKTILYPAINLNSLYENYLHLLSY